MSIARAEIIAASNQRVGLHKLVGIPQLGQTAKDLIDKIVTLSPLDPNYPLTQPFETYYASSLSGSSEQYARKYSLARVLITDGRYENIRFLESAFVPQGEEISPQVQVLKDDLHIRVREALLRRGDKAETEKAEKELKEFAETVDIGKTMDAMEFKKLVALFGGSRIIDILYRTRPEFRGLSVEKVKSIIPDFIGDYAVRKGEFTPGDIEIGVQYLSDLTFQEGFYETLKDHCLQFYNLERKMRTVQSDRELIGEYCDIMDLELQGFKSDLVNQVAQRVRSYYMSLWEDIYRPPQIVDQLKVGRAFPDLNQLINMKEIADKRRMVIADEMGLGKSASVILTKEILQLKCALVIAPANVISTWQRYLSDKKEDGKQVGYFKEGAAPRVVVIDNPATLKKTDHSQADYILISQEKLNNTYTPVLEELDFDMLVVDEVHKLKNLEEGKVRGPNLIKLAEAAEKRNAYVVVLSGTPVPNKVRDLAIILKLLYPEKFKHISNKNLVRKIINGDILDLRSLLIPRMQMKSLKESLDISEPNEVVKYVDLTDEEKEAYDVILEDDELEATEKIRLLRQFLMNPNLFNITPSVTSSKIKAVNDHLNQVFQQKDKVVMFVNDYVEGIIRGERAIFDQMDLPADIEVCFIHGNITRAEREWIQHDLNFSNKKMLVVVSGDTADVGIDLSGGKEVVFYNEPWSKYDKQQQLARVNREGQKDLITSTTFITKGTIEEGISIYIKMKQKAIEKLLRGVELSRIEKEMLLKDEKEDESGLEVNPELAEYYFSSLDRMMKIFGHVKELGEEEFIKYLVKNAEDYADCYVDIGSRSYQSNACRISGTVIAEMIERANQDLGEVKVLDIASGPEMLKKHITDRYKDRIISLDINGLHFRNPGNHRIVGSFTALPIQTGSIDYSDLTLALHYSIFRPTKGKYERLKVLAEMSRVLIVGGRAVLNLMYNADIKNFEKFRIIAEALGFQIVEDYTGEVIVGRQYRSRVITLEKVREVETDVDVIISHFDKGVFEGLKFSKETHKLKDSRKIVREFTINGQSHPINFNQEDMVVLNEEERITLEGEELRDLYGGIKEIPREVIIQHGYARIFFGKKYVLFKKLQNNNGVVIIR